MSGVRGLLLGLAILAIGGGLVLWGSASPFGWIGIAGIAGVLGTGRWGRRIVALLVLAAAIGVVLTEPTFAGWLGAALLTLGAALTLWGSARWPTLGSRYDRAPKVDPWSQLDRGEDPTVHEPLRD